MKTIEHLIDQLEAVAKFNKDEFRYRIEISKGRAGISYGFVCEETADGHNFLESQGNTIEAAIAGAQESIKDSADEWGYRMP